MFNLKTMRTILALPSPVAEGDVVLMSVPPVLTTTNTTSVKGHLKSQYGKRKEKNILIVSKP
jgi:hypothetical protein